MPDPEPIVISISTQPRGAPVPEVSLDVDAQGTNSLVVTHPTEGALPEQESLILDCTAGQPVRMRLRKNALETSTGLSWTLEATPHTRRADPEPWDLLTGDRVDEGDGPSVHTAEFVPVTITATNQSGQTTQTRKKTIHIKIRTNDPMPDSKGLAGSSG